MSSLDDLVLPELPFDEFLQETPPNTPVQILDPWVDHHPGTKVPIALNLPTIRLWCSNEKCGGERSFMPSEKKLQLNPKGSSDQFCVYWCRNCVGESKTIAVQLTIGTNYRLIAMKYGEIPPFGPHLPSRLRNLVGPDQDRFSQGLRSESLGFGIGAFSYYLQVVEDQKDKLIDEIATVSKRVNASTDLLAELDAARKEASSRLPSKRSSMDCHRFYL